MHHVVLGSVSGHVDVNMHEGSKHASRQVGPKQHPFVTIYIGSGTSPMKNISFQHSPKIGTVVIINEFVLFAFG